MSFPCANIVSGRPRSGFCSICVLSTVVRFLCVLQGVGIVAVPTTRHRHRALSVRFAVRDRDSRVSSGARQAQLSLNDTMRTPSSSDFEEIASSPSWRPKPLLARTGRCGSHGSLPTALSSAALMGLPALSPNASASCAAVLSEASVPVASPDSPTKAGVASPGGRGTTSGPLTPALLSSRSWTGSLASSVGASTRPGSRLKLGATQVQREHLDSQSHESVPSLSALRREAMYEGATLIDQRRPWNNHTRGYAVPWRQFYTTDDENFGLEPHPTFVVTGPGTLGATFERPPSFFRPSSVAPPAHAEAILAGDETQYAKDYARHLVHGRSRRSPSHAKLSLASPARDGRRKLRGWNDGFSLARELDRSPTRGGIRVGLNNRLGVPCSSFSTSRRVDSMVQRYVTTPIL